MVGSGAFFFHKSNDHTRVSNQGRTWENPKNKTSAERGSAALPAAACAMATGYYAVMDCRTALYVIGVVSMLSCCPTAPTPRSGDASRAQLVDVTDKLSVRKCNWACGGIRPLSSSSCLPEGTTAVSLIIIAATTLYSRLCSLCRCPALLFSLLFYSRLLRSLLSLLEVCLKS